MIDKTMKKTSVLITLGILLSVSFLFGQEKSKIDTCLAMYLTSEDLNNYLGVYRCDQIQMKILITRDDTILIGQAYGQSPFSLEATEKDLFKSDKYNLKMSFNLAINEMVLTQNGSSFLFTKENHEKLITDTLNFVFEGKILRGYIDMPLNKAPSSIVIIVPGHGKTDFENSFLDLRQNFIDVGVACFMWDRAGCGKSEGNYDGNQTVQSSAKEALVAIDELNRRKVKGASKIGFWSHSRGGWICPLIIQKYPSTAFWISVSGGDGLDSYPYMFESEMRFAGKSEEEIKILLAEKLNASEIFFKGGTYEEYVNAQQNLRRDSFCVSFLGLQDITKESFQKEQESFKGQIELDKTTKSVILVSNFKKVLKDIHCPVLAILGEKDYVVNWRNTLSIYEETIGRKRDILTIKTFPDGNHSIIKCKTGSTYERMDKYEICEGYFETMTAWLIVNGFGK